MPLYDDLKHLKRYVTLLRDVSTERKIYKEVQGNKAKCVLEEGRECNWGEVYKRQSKMSIS